MPKRKIRKAVRVATVYSPMTGRPAKKVRHLSIDAPVGDFSPVKPDGLRGAEPKDPTTK